MKKIIYFSLCVLTLCAYAACASSDSPAKAAKVYAEYMKDGKYDKFADGLAFHENASADQIEQQKEMITSLLKEKGEKELAKQGGLKDIDIVSEEIAEDGLSAKVVLKQTYGNGDSEEATFDMVKRNGTWKMIVKK